MAVVEAAGQVLWGGLIHRGRLGEAAAAALQQQQQQMQQRPLLLLWQQLQQQGRLQVCRPRH